MKQVKKVMAYITRDKDLLVFKHRDHPEAGIQVPAGTVDPGEAIEVALLREIKEESGLEFTQPGRALGKFEWFSEFWQESQLRYVFHLKAPGDTPQKWSHTVTGDAGARDLNLVFEYYWLPIAEAKTQLNGNRGEYLHLI